MYDEYGDAGQDPYDEYDDYIRPRRRRRKRPHSGIGVASFCIAIVAAIGGFLTLVYAGVMAQKHGDLPDDHPIVLIIGLLMLGCMALSFIGLVLGILGACAARRQKVFAWLGLTFNGCLILGVIGLVIVGALAG
jgi:hypothetical protein